MCRVNQHCMTHAFLCLLILIVKFPLLIRSQCPKRDENQCGCQRKDLNSPVFVDNSHAAGEASLTGHASSQFGPSLTQVVHLRFPGGIIFYFIDPTFSKTFNKFIREVLAMAEERIGKKHFEFKEAISSSGEICRKHYIHFLPTAEHKCSSQIGMQLSGETKVWLHQVYCRHQDIVLRELFHAMGRPYEHNRLDRDRYVSVNLDKVLTTMCQEFDHDASSKLIKYDMNSIMHWDSCAASCDGSHVMVTVKPVGQAIPVNKNITELDVMNMQILYLAGEKVVYLDRLCRDSDNNTVSHQSIKVFRPHRLSGGDIADGGCWRLRPLGPAVLTLVAMVTWLPLVDLASAVWIARFCLE